MTDTNMRPTLLRHTCVRNTCMITPYIAESPLNNRYGADMISVLELCDRWTSQTKSITLRDEVGWSDVHWCMATPGDLITRRWPGFSAMDAAGQQVVSLSYLDENIDIRVNIDTVLLQSAAPTHPPHLKSCQYQTHSWPVSEADPF